MGRADPTFSGADLIRYWTRNLTRAVREQVRCFFLLVELTKANRQKWIVSLTRFVIGLLPIIGKPILFILEVVDRIDDLVVKKECIEGLGKVEK